MLCTYQCAVCKSGTCIRCENNYVLILNACVKVSKNPETISLSKKLSVIVNSTFSNPIMDTVNKNAILKTVLNSVCNFFEALDNLWLYSYH